MSLSLPPNKRVLAGAEPARGRNRLHLAVAAALEAQIMSGALAVGEQLPSEGAIARDFDVSTRSVREAIQVLETKGLVRRRQGERTVVVRNDVEEYLGALAVTVRQLLSSDPNYLLQLMVVRRMVETEVVGLLTEREIPIAQNVTDALDEMRVARDNVDFAGFVTADANFHLALVHSAGNEMLSVFYDNLFGLIAEVIQLTSRVPSKSLEAAYAEHADIYSMIRNRDETGAKALMRAQIDNSAEYLRTVIENAKDQRKRMTPDFDYTDTDWDAIKRLKAWYSGDLHDSMEQLGLWGHLEGISLLGALGAGEVVCGPAVTVLFEPSDRKGEPQDVYHHAIDNTPQGGILVCEASCAPGSCSGELMSSGAKTRGAAATIVQGTVRDLAQVRKLGYPLFGTSASPVGVTGKKEPTQSQVPVTIGRVTIRPGDVIFGDIDGVIAIPKGRVREVADLADALGRNEAAARDRILAGEKLQSVWPT